MVKCWLKVFQSGHFGVFRRSIFDAGFYLETAQGNDFFAV
jgi:hypothetical protein